MSPVVPFHSQPFVSSEIDIFCM